MTVEEDYKHWEPAPERGTGTQPAGERDTQRRCPNCGCAVFIRRDNSIVAHRHPLGDRCKASEILFPETVAPQPADGAPELCPCCKGAKVVENDKGRNRPCPYCVTHEYKHVEVDDAQKLLGEWMVEHSFATGHGDTSEDLLKELTWQVEELRNHTKPADGELSWACDVLRSYCGTILAGNHASNGIKEAYETIAERCEKLRALGEDKIPIQGKLGR